MPNLFPVKSINPLPLCFVGKHPQDFVCPDVKSCVITIFSLPQSQRHLQVDFFCPPFVTWIPARSITTNLPNLFPTKEVKSFGPDIISLFKHPQDCTEPFFKQLVLIDLRVPQSHSQIQKTPCFLSFVVSLSITVNRPNLRPVKSSNLPLDIKSPPFNFK